MQTLTTVKRITVICEAILERELTARFMELGARGYSVVECRGDARDDVIRFPMADSGRVRIETLVNEATSQRILDYLRADVYQHYAVIAAVETVEVDRVDYR